MHADQARVSVFDRGFLLGDGVYEVIPVYNGLPFRLTQHLQRLQRSLNGVRMANPYSDDEWCDIIARLVAENGDGDQAVYLQAHTFRSIETYIVVIMVYILLSKVVVLFSEFLDRKLFKYKYV